MDLTVLNLAVPALSADIKPTAIQLLWILDIYGFVLAGMLITMGTLGDRIGRRRLLLLGAGAFAIASIIAACSRSATTLITMRAILGIAGATLAPATLSLIRSMFHNARDRTIAISVWTASYSAGAAIGPIVGGFLLEYFWWGSVFLLSLPVILLLLILGPVLLPEYRDPDAGHLDIPSAVLSLAAILASVYGLKHMAEMGFSWLSAFSICGGILLGATFLHRQSHLQSPLFDLRLLHAPAFAPAFITYTLASFVSFGALVFVAQYMQLVLGLSPLQAALWSVPPTAIVVLGAAVTPFFSRRVQPPTLLIAGLSLGMVGFSMLARVDQATNPLTLSGVCCIYAFGLACVYTVAMDLIVGSVPPQHAGAASAMSETGSELGGALGIALLGSLLAIVYRLALTHSNPESVAAGIETLGATVQKAHQLGGVAGSALLEAGRAAFVAGFRATAVVSVLVLALAAVLVARWRVHSSPVLEGDGYG
jgi:DHA2 family multidrug resistance protein-like MFS transporter